MIARITNGINGKRKGLVGLTLLLALAFTFLLVLSQTSSASVTFQGRACSGNSICDVIRKCDSAGCTSSFDNCQACPSSTKTCPNGPVTVPGTCVESGGVPSCTQGTATCPSGPPSGLNSGEPYVILTFTVFTKKNLVINITPTSQAGLAGSTLNYQLGLENKNPKSLTFQVSSQLPPGWTINIPEQFSISQNSAKQVQFRVTSNDTAADASYPIIIGVFNSELNLYGTATAQYVVATRGTPGISTEPKSQTGYPGQVLFYNVSVTNNDPKGFDATSISLRATALAGFNTVFTPTSIKLQPGETGSVRLDVTSPLNATENAYKIGINATANKLSGFDTAEYKVDFCGNNVCDIGEEGKCAVDCPLDSNFICDGRCERELDDGLAFSANVNVQFNRFIICSRNSTIASCIQTAGSVSLGGLPGITNTTTTGSCGVGKTCICSSSQSNCNALCVDKKGVYYLLADGDSDVRSIANYSFACPFVNLPEIISLRDNFTKAKQDYEKAQSALKETLKAPNITSAKRAETQPCVDALTSIIGITGNYVDYLNHVIAWPGKINTTAARARAVDVRTSIESTYNTFCRGVTGLLQIDSIIASAAEKGGLLGLSVTLKNIGNVPYNGYAQCDFTGGQGEKFTAGSECSSIGGQQSSAFDISANATSAGKWTARCKALGSVAFECTNASVHDEASVQFNVSTREAFVVDVSGVCNGAVTCSVRTSNPGCGACTANGRPCTRSGSDNGTDLFNCPSSFGNITLVGSIISSRSCQPVAPTQKNITVRCTGCGDGTVGTGEQCEFPFTDNNQLCSQAQTACEGRLFGVRDAAGLCGAACMCSYDRYEFSCTPGQCNAECGDTNTRVVNINKTNGACRCVQQCGSGCTWNPCDCEPGGTPISVSGVPFVDVQHSPQPPTSPTVTITATGGNFTKLEVYVDGFVVKTCQILPCSINAKYDPGLHTYFARATNSRSFATDPTDGSKAFTVPGTSGGGGGSGGGNGTRLNTTTVILDVSHSPDSPLTQDSVLLTAIAHGPRTFREINIFIDGALRKTCSNYAPSQECTLRNTYPAGNHAYYATAVDVTNMSARSPDTGTKGFTVSGAGGGGGIGGSGPGPPGTGGQGLGACYVKILSKNCTYNTDTRRYDVALIAEWDNGTHAHWIIEDNTGPKIYTKNFTHVEPVSAPGVKTVKAVVHNVNDSTLCFASEQIYCGPGTSTGKDLDIIFDVKDVVKIGTNDVRIIATPYRDITPVRLQSFTDSALVVGNIRVEGNSSLSGVSGPLRIQENASYNVYTITMNLAAGMNISVHYKLNITSPGQYTLMAVANYSGKTQRVTKTIKATTCSQAYSILAVGPSGVCSQFTTPCDKPPGWQEVGVCPDQIEKPVQQGGDNTLLIVIIVVIIIVLAVLGYRYRDQIREKLHRSPSRRKQEEMPSLNERY